MLPVAAFEVVSAAPRRHPGLRIKPGLSAAVPGRRSGSASSASSAATAAPASQRHFMTTIRQAHIRLTPPTHFFIAISPCLRPLGSYPSLRGPQPHAHEEGRLDNETA